MMVRGAAAPTSGSRVGPDPGARLRRAGARLAFSLAILACSEPSSSPPLDRASNNLSVGETQPSRSSPAGVAAAPAPVWVLMRESASIARFSATRNWKVQGEQVAASLRGTAASTQRSLQAFLRARNVPFKSFWIANALRVTAAPALIAEIARRPDVARIVPDRRVAIPPFERRTSAVPSVPSIEWGLSNIRATDVWDRFGAQGDGIVVANIDTGVEVEHPALVHQYRGYQAGRLDHAYNWYDPTGACGAPSDGPCDNVGHGTHTLGTLLGDDLAGNQIGVAPHARWIAVKGCEDEVCSNDSLLRAGEWLLAPTDANGENPRPELRPNIINNSWSGDAADPFYQALVQAWRAAGIFAVFAAGNTGEFGCRTIGSPADYPEAYSVGAYDIDNVIAPFSSRGPSRLDGSIKPDIAAPGVDVRSSVPGGYAVFSGASMAAPHVAGAVALLWSAAPSLIGDIDATIALLGAAAVDTSDFSCGGVDGRNGVWGEGRLDAFAAVDRAPRVPAGVLSGSVSTEDQRPLAGAHIVADGPVLRDTFSDAAGNYRLALPIGSYGVTASTFGYVSSTLGSVEIVERETHREAFSLQEAPAFSVSGTLTDVEGRPIAGASVAIVDTPIPGATTDADGAYVFTRVPEGTYELQLTPGGCNATEERALIVDGTQKLDVVAGRHVDGFGHFCRLVPFDFIEASRVLPITFDGAREIALPFPFSFYGREYSSAEISATGYVQFGPRLFSGLFTNTPIPDAGWPNAAIYPFWDDLVVDTGSSVRTEVVGAAPDRQFVIEWRNVVRFSDFVTPVRFELVLHEDGRIGMQYETADPAATQKGSSATVGLENATASDAFQYSFNAASLSSGLAVLYDVMPAASRAAR